MPSLIHEFVQLEKVLLSRMEMHEDIGKKKYKNGTKDVWLWCQMIWPGLVADSDLQASYKLHIIKIKKGQ